MFQQPHLSQNVCEQLLRAQATRLMVTLYIINPYELRKEAKPHGENPPSRMDMKEKPKYVYISKLNEYVWRNLLLGKKWNVLNQLRNMYSCMMNPGIM